MPKQGLFILCFYVDDIVVIGDDENTIAELEGFGTPLGTPLEVNKKVLAYHRSILEDPKAFQRLVGKLIYLTITRPDLPQAV